jgi:hypothetical protein
MIPISKDKRLEWTDDESGVVYSFRPLIGETELVANEVWEGWRNTDSKDMKKMSELADQLINATLTGWRPVADKSVDLPAFPTDGNPAAMFTIVDKTKMLYTIQRVNSLSEDEKKN